MLENPARCPLTHNSGEFVRTLSVAELDRRWRDELQVDPGQAFRDLPAITHWRCSETGLEWYEPKSAAGDEKLYEALSRYPWYYMKSKWEFDVGLTFMKPGQRVLEVGVGFGHFLEKARAAGADVCGVEFNSDAAEKARRAGFVIFDEPLDAIAAKGAEPFDCVCSYQVLEHVTEPDRFLKDMAALIKPGGRLILSTPNADVMRFADPDWLNLLDQPPHHMTHWNEKAFRSLEKLLRVRVEAFVREPLQTYHVAWYALGLTTHIRRALGPFLGDIFGGPAATKAITELLDAGLRKRIAGHTLLAVFQRLP